MSNIVTYLILSVSYEIEIIFIPLLLQVKNSEAQYAVLVAEPGVETTPEGLVQELTYLDTMLYSLSIAIQDSGMCLFAVQILYVIDTHIHTYSLVIYACICSLIVCTYICFCI